MHIYYTVSIKLSVTNYRIDAYKAPLLIKPPVQQNLNKPPLFWTKVFLDFVWKLTKYKYTFFLIPQTYRLRGKNLKSTSKWNGQQNILSWLTCSTCNPTKYQIYTMSTHIQRYIIVDELAIDHRRLIFCEKCYFIFIKN